MILALLQKRAKGNIENFMGKREEAAVLFGGNGLKSWFYHEFGRQPKVFSQSSMHSFPQDTRFFYPINLHRIVVKHRHFFQIQTIFNSHSLRLNIIFMNNGNHRLAP